jgi:hypothetical protein
MSGSVPVVPKQERHVNEIMLPTVDTEGRSIWAGASTLTTLSETLAGAATRADFVATCRRIVDASTDVQLNPDALEALIPGVAAAQPVSWSWYVRPGTPSLHEAAFDLASMAAPNGGYFYPDADGRVRQWAVDGSGATALQRWSARLRDAGCLPGVQMHDPDQVRSAVAPFLAGVPYPDARLQIAAELACPRRRQRFDQLLDASRTPDGTWWLTLEVADHLAAIYPTAFAEDPFRKKAVLALIMLHGYLHHAGAPVVCETPLPADYQLPRIFHYTGCLEIAPGLARTLGGADRLLDAESDAVTALRAGAVVLADMLARATGQPDGVVDGALFIPFRRDPDFRANSLPAMRCATMWF